MSLQKPQLISTRDSLSRPVDCKNERVSYFYNPWHYHPEIELTLVQEGYGQRIIGDSIDNFSPGDLILVGSNLPHIWKNAPSFYEETNRDKVCGIVVKFHPDFAGGQLWELPEMEELRRLVYHKANRGLKLTGALKEEVTAILTGFPPLSESARIIRLLDILHRIASSEEVVPLASPTYQGLQRKIDPRISAIVNYMFQNFDREIRLEELAGLIPMNKNAFCRFFRNETGKTMGDYLTGLRIGSACQRLQEGKEKVEIIAQGVGYHNYSNFNKAFRKFTGQSPAQYRKNCRNIFKFD